MPEDDPTPLTPAGFQVLLALATGRAHGYGIMGYLNEVSRGSIHIGPGTLYRTLARLKTDGLVREVDHERPDEPHDARRRYYELTRAGWDAAARTARLTDALARAARSAGLLDERRARSA